MRVVKKTKKISSGSGRNEVLDTIRERIVSGQIPPGTKLVESDLIREFGVSRSVVRSVLNALEVEGLVGKQPNKGVTVRIIDFTTLIEIMEIRQSLESLAARLAAEKTAAEDWKDLEVEFGKPLEDSVERLDFDKYFRLIAEFRHRMLLAAQNEELSKIVNSLFSKIQMVQRRIIILPGRVQEAVREHKAVLQAIMAGDADEAERLKRLNLQSATECLKNYKKWLF